MENKKMLKVLIKEPYKEPYVKEIEDTLEAKQEIVGGSIECISMPNVKNVDLYVNEEGKLYSMAGNFWLPEYEDCVAGTCFITGYDEDTGENVDIKDKDIEKCKDYVNTFQIPVGLDLYLDFKVLEAFMKGQYKKYKNKQEELE